MTQRESRYKRPSARREKRWRTLDDSLNEPYRGAADLTDMEPGDATFGGPGREIVTVDNMTGRQHDPVASRCDDKECRACYPKRKKRRRRP